MAMASGLLALAGLWLAAAGPAQPGLGVVAAAPAPPAAEKDGCIGLDGLAGEAPGQFPSQWKARQDEGRAVYTVREEGGLRYLHAESRGLGIQAAREVTGWSLETHPILAWSWRPLQFPQGADERESRTNDSPLAVYFLVDYHRVRGPRALKYIWSEKVPVGTALTSNTGLTQVRVLKSGVPAGREWVEERVDVRADYLKAFDQKVAPRPAGIAVLTDADDTRSAAEGDYARIRACRH